MATEWYYSKEGQQVGPVSAKELKRLAGIGGLQPNDQVWKEGMDEWEPADKVKELFPVAAAPVPAQPKAVTTQPAPSPPPFPPPAPKPKSSTKFDVSSAANAFSGLMGSMKNKLNVGMPTQNGSATLGNDEKIAEPEDAVPPTRLPDGVTEDDVVAKVSATYQGGHPSLTMNMVGTLLLTNRGVDFLAADPQNDLTIPYEQVKDILKPRKGSFPKEMLERAEKTKSRAKAGKFVAGIAGSMIGGTMGRAAKAVGRGAADASKEGAALGPTPKNRVTVIFIDASAEFKVLFDVSASSTEEMEEQTEQLWMQTASLRGGFYKSTKPARPQRKSETSPTLTQARQPSQVVSGGLRVLKDGTEHGPFSADEIQSLIGSGELSATDLIRVEVWVPVGTMGLLLGGGSFEPVPQSQSPDQGQAEAKDLAVKSGETTDSQPKSKGRGKMIAAAAGGAVAGVAASSLLSRSAKASGGRRTGSSGVAIDRDGDGNIDAVGIDLDGDGTIDAVGIDRDGDGSIDAIGIDRDGDGVIDVVGIDQDGDGDIDIIGYDTDGDGEIDTYEDVEDEEEEEDDDDDDDDDD